MAALARKHWLALPKDKYKRVCLEYLITIGAKYSVVDDVNGTLADIRLDVEMWNVDEVENATRTPLLFTQTEVHTPSRPFTASVYASSLFTFPLLNEGLLSHP